MGKLQRELFGIIFDYGKPITYTDIVARLCAVEPSEVPLIRSSSLARNIRRAIHSMVQRSELIALGKGGREEPHRYFFHPMFLAVREKTDPAVPPLQAALNADPGLMLAIEIDTAPLRHWRGFDPEDAEP
jgi:hypothetical protein